MKLSSSDFVCKIGKRNLNAPYNWELLNFSNLRFSKPTVLCLSGNGTTRNQDANSLAKQVEKYLDLMFEPKQNYYTLNNVDIMSVKYARIEGLGEIVNGELSKQAVEQIAHAIFLLLVDANHQRIQIEQAKQNMSRITFFTFCAGNKELQKIINCLNEKLLSVGYREDEVYAINRATLEVSYAPLNVLYNRIPSVRIVSKRDDVIGCVNFGTLKRGGVLTEEQSQNLNGILLHKDKLGSLNGVTRDVKNSCFPNLPVNTVTAESIQIISGALLNTYSGEISEHRVEILARGHFWKIKPTIIKNIAYCSSNANCVSQMIAWALCKGVENSIQNFKSENYVLNLYWNELLDDFYSIMKSFKRKKLLIKKSYTKSQDVLIDYNKKEL